MLASSQYSHGRPLSLIGNGRPDPDIRIREIPETQPAMETEPSTLHDELEPETDALPQSVMRHSNTSRQRSSQRQTFPMRRRAGSASDGERTGGEPALRRKIGDITRKLEAVDLRYRNLRESRSTEAEANYERLKKQSEANAKGLSISSGFRPITERR